MVRTRSYKASDEPSLEATLGENINQSPLGSIDGPSCVNLVKRTARQKANPKCNDASTSSNTKVAISDTETVSKVRQRLKWTPEMNECVMRSYYKCTTLETELTAYREKMFREFRKHYPEINVTQQRVADRKRTIVE